MAEGEEGPEPAVPSDGEEPSIALEPEPASVGRARRWVASQLAEWSEDGQQMAELVTSELVTNVLLHARTRSELVLRPLGSDRVRIAVVDRSRVAPTLKDYGPGAVTGRGLMLVEHLSERWGVEVTSAGKTVWIELRDDPGLWSTSAEAPLAVEEWAEMEPVSDGPLPPTGASATPPMVEVHILGLPLAVYLAAQEHNDALLREFAFIAESDPDASVPRRLVELARETEGLFGPASARARAQVEQAQAAGQPTVDLTLSVPRVAWSTMRRLSDLLDEADIYCSQGDLLTLATPPELRYFRAWYSGQVRDQLEGLPPTSWVAPPP
jgi:anti-sigma regulatory factor (Ser/Thr protein kinase)